MTSTMMMALTLFYVLGLTVVGFLAYLGIKGTNEAIDYQNRRDK